MGHRVGCLSPAEGLTHGILQSNPGKAVVWCHVVMGEQGQVCNHCEQVKSILHWWTDEPRNEARYEPQLVYEARKAKSAFTRLVSLYEARNRPVTSLVERRRSPSIYEPRKWLVYEARNPGLSNFSWCGGR